MIDYHIHLENGPLTLEWLQQFWEVAQERGISEIGISEHSHKFKEFYPIFQYLTEGKDSYDYMQQWISNDFKQSLPDYIDLLFKAQQQGIPVKIGLEVDYLAKTEDKIKKILKEYPFDYVIGSVHVIDKWGFDYYPQAWEGKNVDEAYQGYFNTLTKAISSGLFDIIGHFDVIKVFGHRNSVNVDQDIEDALRALVTQGICLEISSAGLRKPVQEIYPSKWILEKAYHLQIPITIGSDAHFPKDVGADWETIVTLAGECGYREYRVFTQRQAYAKKLPKLK